jgi:hypothetical protein
MSDQSQTQTQTTDTTTQGQTTNDTQTAGQTTDQTQQTDTTKDVTNVLGDKTPDADPFDESKLTLPEGFEKNEGWTEFTNIAKNLKHADAQKLVSLASEAIAAREKSIAEYWQKTHGEWQKEIMADPELGGTNFETMRQTVSKVLDNPELSDPKMREALVLTGAGNHPAIVRTLFKWAKALSEGGSVAGNPPGRDAQGNAQGTGQRPSIADAMYPGGPRNDGPSNPGR